MASATLALITSFLHFIIVANHDWVIGHIMLTARSAVSSATCSRPKSQANFGLKVGCDGC